MAGRQTGVFVQMECRHAPPIDGGIVAQHSAKARRQKFVLRRRGGEHHARPRHPCRWRRRMMADASAAALRHGRRSHDAGSLSTSGGHRRQAMIVGIHAF
jgi:hypothetical protein